MNPFDFVRARFAALIRASDPEPQPVEAEADETSSDDEAAA